MRYGFLTLGEVTITMFEDTTHRGEHAHYVFSEIKSNPGLPLVGYKERHYHSFMGHNDTTVYSLLFWTDSIHDNLYEETVYDYDYGTEKLYTFEEGF